MIHPARNRWADAVEALAPRLGPLSFLRVTFRPDWQRWCVWQLVPPAAIPAVMWAEDTPLRGSIEGGFFRVQPDERCRILLERDNMTRYAWALYLETGCYAQPLWIVQGARGGHKWQFTHEEATVSQLNGGPKAPPAAGDLPYAPVDRRVLEMLAPLDDLMRWRQSAKLLHERDHRDLDREELETAIEHRERLWSWLGSQVDETFDDTPFSKRPALGGDPEWDEDPEAIHENFVMQD